MPTLSTIQNEVLEPPKDTFLFDYYRPRFADEHNAKPTIRAVYKKLLELIRDDKNRFELYHITEDDANSYRDAAAWFAYEIVKSGYKL